METSNPKKIVKARVGKCLNIDTSSIMFQLQFKAEGEHRYRGFSTDTFEDAYTAKQALRKHNDNSRTYVPYLTKGKYFFCRVAR
ncbi:hypothetical protein [Bacteroides sp.]|uniref:hypothetical protein n=1 Tax=Bacteroides sp. TaxID=29523 RepID=UPI002620EF3F|nr:hypothetical protein [Bacteroides sp.]MDD3037922.1 hypothetical protein [Bacteroides sp.]